MRTTWLWTLGVVALLASLTGMATAGPNKFARVPGAKASGKTAPLQMRTVTYNGGTNGRMVIEVRNDAKTEQSFEAAGLYFVPGGDPKQAPQRLGAAGPFELVTEAGASGEPVQTLSVAPGATVRLELHVFCIDSHRSSPSSSTPFSVANKRMPKKLRATIQTGTSDILKRHKNKLAPKASAEIQSHVWQTRDADWVELEGERAGEKTQKTQRQQRVGPDFARPPRQHRRERRDRRAK